MGVECTPFLLMIIGPNGSGKSSFITISGHDTGIDVINPDNHARSIVGAVKKYLGPFI